MTRFRETCNNCTKKDTDKCESLDDNGKTIIEDCLKTWACCDLLIKNDEETEAKPTAQN